jgi:pyrroloquinoline quinone biosynthesis protein E
LKGKDLDLDLALSAIQEAASLGARQVNLSGGETLLYPELIRLINECKALGLESNIAISGWGASPSRLQELKNAGLTRVFVSLNGSTETINRRSREGFSLAMSALDNLKEVKFSNTIINWVAHAESVPDFRNMLKLCERHGVPCLFVLGVKPDAAGKMDTAPDARQTKRLAREIQEAKMTSRTRVVVESCYSSLRAYLGASLAGNTNIGLAKGCPAGKLGVSANVEGRFAPCRHLQSSENFGSLTEYWENSLELQGFRTKTQDPACAGCALSQHCTGCAAISRASAGNGWSCGLMKAGEKGIIG